MRTSQMIIWWHCALRKWLSGGTARAHFANDYLVALRMRTLQIIIWWHCALRKWSSDGTAHFANDHLVALRMRTIEGTLAARQLSVMVVTTHSRLTLWSGEVLKHATSHFNTSLNRNSEQPVGRLPEHCAGGLLVGGHLVASAYTTPPVGKTWF